MKIITRHPDRGYLDCHLWVPKHLINVTATQSALSFLFTDSYSKKQRVLYLWKETTHHLLVPRAFWEVGSLPFEVIDCRPRKYTEVDFKSWIKLDHLPGIDRILIPTGGDVQQLSIDAMSNSMGGVLQLRCLSGDTILNLNRNSKGFKMTIREACLRMQGTHRYKWAPTPTYTRAELTDRIGLHPIKDIIYRGKRQTYLLTLEDGKMLRLTADHEVLTPNGWKSIEGGLSAGTEVITDSGQKKWGRKSKSSKKSKIVYRRLSWYQAHPYAYKNGTENGPRRGKVQRWTLEEHRAVAEAALNDMSLDEFRSRCREGRVDGLTFINPTKFDVHHRDGNPKNNKLDNLEVVPKSQHQRILHPSNPKNFGYGEPVPAKVQSIRIHGMEDVYDVVCASPHHNFVANGIVVHNCGAGKTLVALEKIARGRVPALVVVDNTNLLEQWLDDIKEFLDVPGGVGVMGAGKFDWKKGLVVATYQTLAQKADELPEEIRRWFGQIFWDEAHHINAITFSKTADLFYGQRYALTATPRRDDGLHIICDFHIGRVLHQDLRQPLKARLIFRWTGLELDLTDPHVSRAVLDVNGEVHTSKVPGYFGQWRNRLWMILQDCIDALNVGRKILVLSNAVDEVVNLMTLWTRGAHASLYTDVPVPTPAEVGWNLSPLNLSPIEIKNLEKKIKTAWIAVDKGQSVNEPFVTDLMMLYQQHLTHRAIINEHDRRQRAFLKQLLTEPSNAGLMTFGVPAKMRQKFLHERPVVFAITKYGKEGLDCPDLDTVLVATLFSGKNALQQLMGRPTRPKAGKKKPMVVFYVDNIGQYHGMSQKLMKHLRDWPHEEGGPFDYELLDYPKVSTCKASSLAVAFGQ